MALLGNLGNTESVENKSCARLSTNYNSSLQVVHWNQYSLRTSKNAQQISIFFCWHFGSRKFQLKDFVVALFYLA